jgi:hypothetical protein
MHSTCINFNERFGARYKVQFEEAYCAERPERRAVEGPWLMFIPGKNRANHIYPFGGDLLAVFVTRHNSIFRRIKNLSYTCVHSDGDDGVTFTFPSEHFEEIAQIIRARRRRVITEAERQRIIANTAKYRFLPGLQVNLEARICAQSAPKVF